LPPPAKAASALGTAGGTTKPNIGGATGDAKPGVAQTKKVFKKKPSKHPPKRKH
jgi:hypothetical protein